MSFREELSDQMLSIAVSLGFFIFGANMTATDGFIGKRFGRFIVWHRSSYNPRQQRWYYMCLCDCGTFFERVSSSIGQRNIVSCGCFKRQLSKERCTTHGLYHHPLRYTWTHIIQRCYNPNCKAYHNYGGRGIKMSQKWRKSFSTFLDNILKEIGDRPSIKYSLDRIDNDKGYYPRNIRWATAKEQCNNTRFNRHIKTPDGKYLTITQAADQLGVKVETLYARKKSGWSDLKTMTTPIKKVKRNILTKEQIAELKDLYAAGNFTYLQLRKKFGISITLISMIINGHRHK